jgi:hypothetical protein
MDRSDLIFRAQIGLVVAVWFVVLYGSADMVMRGASDLPSVLTPWDEMLPFWPSFAWLYLSVTPFLCLPLLVIPDRIGLKVLAVTLMVEIAVGALIFVTFPVADPLFPPGPHPAPLRFADMINLDLNNLPSLHVALTVTTFLAVWPCLGRAQVPVALWATLVCFSTLVTRQHDLVSFAAGVILAAVGHWAVAPMVRRALSGPA